MSERASSTFSAANMHSLYESTITKAIVSRGTGYFRDSNVAAWELTFAPLSMGGQGCAYWEPDYTLMPHTNVTNLYNHGEHVSLDRIWAYTTPASSLWDWQLVQERQIIPIIPLNTMASVWDAAEIAIRELRTLGYDGACFVGGVACALYGNSRDPKDLDILIVNTGDDQETIKRNISYRNSSFYLIPSKKVGQTYKVLWYDKYRSGYISPTRASATSIKVDILLPGIMDIPSFDKRYIARVSHPSRSVTLPTAPLSLVLLLKLQAWSQHRAALEYYYSKEQYKDQRDLDSLVPIAAGKGIQPKNDVFLSAEFIIKAETRIKEFLGMYKESLTRSGWSTMGFTVPPKARAAQSAVVTSSLSPDRESSRLITRGISTTTAESDTARKYNVRPLPKVRPLYSYGSSRY